MQQIRALRFDVEEVGKHVKGSKKRFTWEVALKDKHHILVLDYSFVSGKVKITCDRKIMHETEVASNMSFQYPFTLDGFALNMIQQGESFELRINNKVFSHLYTQNKTNTEFKKYEDQVKDIKVNFSQANPTAQHKKISLNIGAFAGKKKRETSASDGNNGSWNAFAGGDFPNYFGDNSQAAPEVKPQAPPPVANLLQDDPQPPQPQPESPQKEPMGDLISTTVESKPQESLFAFDAQPAQPENNLTASAAQEFNTMQNMFNTMAVSSPSNQVDFFSESTVQPSQPAPSPPVPQATEQFTLDLNPPSQLAETVPPPAPVVTTQVAPAPQVTQSTPSSLDFNFASSNNPSASAFATGFGMQQPAASQISSKNFATTNFGNTGGNQLDLSANSMFKPTESTFKKAPVTQPISLSATAQPVEPTQPVASEIKPVENPMSQLSQAFQGTASQPNAADFSTLQLMFQTTNYSDLQNQGAIPPMAPAASVAPVAPVAPVGVVNPPVAEQPPKSNPLDMFNNNMPASFSTMSGSAQPSTGIDMSAFGTMQAGQKPGEMNLDFLQSMPPPAKKQSDLI